MVLVPRCGVSDREYDILLVTANAEPFTRSKADGARTHVTCVGNDRALKWCEDASPKPPCALATPGL